MRRNWAPIIETACAIVDSYDTGVTLRQLFYRLVSREILRNTQADYTTLSKLTAAARRDGSFPPLLDNTRAIVRPLSYHSPERAKAILQLTYRRDRTEGQDFTVYLGVEKAGMIEQLRAWFEDLGLPILALRGYSSQTFIDEVQEDILQQGRPSVLLYGGDFDPSGEDIERDFAARVGCFDEVQRVALTPEQVKRYKLPPLPGKPTDSRSQGFIEKHGHLVQVELDALPPDVLHGLFADAVKPFVDTSVLDSSIEQEEQDILKL